LERKTKKKGKSKRNLLNDATGTLMFNVWILADITAASLLSVRERRVVRAVLGDCGREKPRASCFVVRQLMERNKL
jgi:hypothetical protein